ncbi:MAG: RNA polymerase sigma-70 factor [Odoribacter sp.]|nr:RNA polymerase sigma-70 factor [Odoribacter sp.]MDY3033750.1 RNA polymerase sigma-70 factor [Odoribacter sp.]
MDDKDLLKKVNRKDEQAWRVFFRSYYDSLFHHALRILEDEKEAEDVVQELFIALWNNGIMLGENDSLSGYLYRAVTNRCLNRIRDQKRMNEHLAKWKEEAEGEASEAEFASAVREEVMRRLLELIELLPEGRKTILKMSMEGKSGEEIARQLGVSITTVKQQKYRAYRFLRDNMGESWVVACLLLEGSKNFL